MLKTKNRTKLQTRTIWTCDYCNQEFDTKKESDKHELVCKQNPLNNKKSENKNITNVLLIVVVIILGLLFFENEIQSFFKTRKITKEVLDRINIYNIPDVAEACFYYNQDLIAGVETHIDTYQDCEDQVNKYWLDTDRWENLIKQNKDLNCNDFENGKDARMFYHYVSGELAKGFQQAINANGESVVRLTGKLRCVYDPYGLDTNSDCNACENQ